MKTAAIYNSFESLAKLSQKNVSNILGISANTLSTYKNKEWIEVKELNGGQKLFNLLYVLEALNKDKSLSPDIIYKVLLTSAFKLEDGSLIDVSTGCKLGFAKEELLAIADFALEHLRKPYKNNINNLKKQEIL